MVIIIITPISRKWKAVGKIQGGGCCLCEPLLEVFGVLSIIWSHNVFCWLTITGRMRREGSHGVNCCCKCEDGGFLTRGWRQKEHFGFLRIMKNTFREHNGNVWLKKASQCYMHANVIFPHFRWCLYRKWLAVCLWVFKGVCWPATGLVLLLLPLSAPDVSSRLISDILTPDRASAISCLARSRSCLRRSASRSCAKQRKHEEKYFCEQWVGKWGWIRHFPNPEKFIITPWRLRRTRKINQK